jgi:hypothetical protein
MAYYPHVSKQVMPFWLLSARFKLFSKTASSFKLLFELKTKATSNANGRSCAEAGAHY